MNDPCSKPASAAWLDRLLSLEVLKRTDPHPCAYLEGRSARSQGFRVGSMPGNMYELLLERNFRRSGDFFYRASCDDCRACRQLRVPVNTFRRSRSFERVWKLNADLNVVVGPPQCSSEKLELYRRYLDDRHGRLDPGDGADFVSFLYQSPTDTVEICYQLGERLLAVSIADVLPRGLSSVYVYFDPDYARRSLGTFSALWEIEYCRATHRHHYYLGYHVEGSPSMAYKARFRPHETLGDQGTWQPCGP